MVEPSQVYQAETHHSFIHQLLKCFEINQKSQFTGKVLAYSHTGQQWAIYFLFGRLIWACGGNHRFRRWFRLLSIHASHLNAAQLPIPDGAISRLWEYSLLCLLVRQQRLSMDQATALVRQAVAEVLFEVLQEAEGIQQSDHCARRIKKLGEPIIVLRPGQCLNLAQQKWHQWRQGGLISYSPNLSPILRYPEKLEQQLSPAIYTKLSTLLTGRRSLRGLSAHLNMDLMSLTQSLIPFVNQGIIALNPIPDLIPQSAKPSNLQSSQSSSLPPTPDRVDTRPLVLGIDDSPSICQLLEKILTENGYRFIGVQKSFQALPMIMKHKPDLVLLDLAMPVANGYEVCAQIRRVSKFQSLPIVIVSGNDGMVDRVRARLVGATGFLSKPFQTKDVLDATRQYLTVSAPKNNGD